MLMVLVLAVVAFAYNRSSTGVASDCCRKADACPMKKDAKTAKTGTGDAKVSCCDMPECCCNSGACPMMKKGENKAAADHSPEVNAAEHAMDCCKDGKSCPMHSAKEGHGSSTENKHAEMAAMHHASAEAPHRGCSCCMAKD